MWLARIHSVGSTHWRSFSASFWMAGVSKLGWGTGWTCPIFRSKGAPNTTRKMPSPTATALRL